MNICQIQETNFWIFDCNLNKDLRSIKTTKHIVIINIYENSSLACISCASIFFVNPPIYLPKVLEIITGYTNISLLAFPNLIKLATSIKKPLELDLNYFDELISIETIGGTLLLTLCEDSPLRYLSTSNMMIMNKGEIFILDDFCSFMSVGSLYCISLNYFSRAVALVVKGCELRNVAKINWIDANMFNNLVLLDCKKCFIYGNSEGFYKNSNTKPDIDSIESERLFGQLYGNILHFLYDQ